MTFPDGRCLVNPLILAAGNDGMMGTGQEATLPRSSEEVDSLVHLIFAEQPAEVIFPGSWWGSVCGLAVEVVEKLARAPTSQAQPWTTTSTFGPSSRLASEHHHVHASQMPSCKKSDAAGPSGWGSTVAV